MRSVTGRLDTLNRKIVTSDLSECPRGHFKSWKVTSTFSAITFDSDELERWKHHYMCWGRRYGSTDCNMILPKVKLHTVKLHIPSLFNASRQREHDELSRWMSCPYFNWVKSYYRKTFFVKRLFLKFCSLEAKPRSGGRLPLNGCTADF